MFVLLIWMRDWWLVNRVTVVCRDRCWLCEYLIFAWVIHHGLMSRKGVLRRKKLFDFDSQQVDMIDGLVKDCQLCTCVDPGANVL